MTLHRARSSPQRNLVIPTSTSCLISRRSHKCALLTLLSNTTSPTTSSLRVLQSPLVPDAWHQNDSRSPEKSLSTCCSWELSVPHPVSGLLPCTWCQRRPQVIGVHVAIIVHSIASPFQTAILSHTSKIFLPPSKVLPSSPSWTWYVPTIRFL